MRKTRWNSLISALSLHLTERFYGFLGCPIRSREGLRLAAAQVLQTCFDRGERFGETHIEEFLSILTLEFGVDQREEFLRWIELIWKSLDGPSWDWFAYEFAFSRWHNNKQHIFSFGEHTAWVAECFRRYCIQPSRDFDRETERWAGLPMTPWDRQVLEFARWRLTPDGPEEIGDLGAILSGPVRAICFQDFWRVLLEHRGMAAISPIYWAVDGIVRAETSFPMRTLLTPEQLPMLDRANPL